MSQNLSPTSEGSVPPDRLLDTCVYINSCTLVNHIHVHVHTVHVHVSKEYSFFYKHIYYLHTHAYCGLHSRMKS